MTDPASTPISGFCPSAIATRPPMMFCSAATMVEMTKKMTTRKPPRTSSATLAPNPTDAKNAFCSGVCSVVSNFSGWMPEK